MKYVLTPEEVKLADKIAIEEYGIPGIILMENAARSISDILNSKYDLKNKNILIVCGSGNNGGDGFALARHLIQFTNVTVYYIGGINKMSEETSINFNSLLKLGVKLLDVNLLDVSNIDWDFSFIIDSLIGVGGNENLRGKIIELLSEVNKINAIKVAVDVPSGLNSLTGLAHSDCFKADLTITMFAPKIGLYLNDGIELCGEIETANLTAPISIVQKLAKIKILENDDFRYYFPNRKKNTSKFDYGRVLVIAGCRKMPGAAALTANAAISTGAGLVELVSTDLHKALKPEIIPKLITNKEYLTNNDFEEICRIAEKCDIIVIGPGIGSEYDTINLVKKLIKKLLPTKKILVDADALKAIEIHQKYGSNLILTPHIGEFANIIRKERTIIQNDYFYKALEFSQKSETILHLKTVPSLTTNGKITYVNPYGNPGMATAGSGDVLSGIIAGMLANGLNTFEAAFVGAYTHSKTGDYLARQYSENTLTAGMLIDNLKNVFS